MGALGPLAFDWALAARDDQLADDHFDPPPATPHEPTTPHQPTAWDTPAAEPCPTWPEPF